MHAERLEGDVAHDDQLVVALVIGKRGGIEWHRGQELGKSAGHPPGRLPQALVREVGAKRDQKASRGLLSCVEVNDAFWNRVQVALHLRRAIGESRGGLFAHRAAT
jgi:hypothetical protein